MSKLDKQVKHIIFNNTIAFALLGGLSLVLGVAGMGAMAVVFGVVNCLGWSVYFISGEPEKARASLLVGGLFLLSGLTLCSAFQFSVR